MSPPKNVAASVKAQLLNKAKETGQVYNDVLQLYAMERFLYRLSMSDYAETFILKGALLFLVWEPVYRRRTTLDIDLLGFSENSLPRLKQIAREICETDVEDDGVIFDSEAMRVQRIKEDAEYEGVRIRTHARLERSRVPIQIDIGFGDAVVPKAVSGTVPTLLDFPAPKLRCYQPLTVIAEKFQAMIQLAEFNSRMKDFYDVWNIIQHEAIGGAELREACLATFQQRDTPLNAEGNFFTEAFAHAPEKQVQWAAFVRKQGLGAVAPSSFGEVVMTLQGFFRPMIEGQRAGNDFSAIWRGGGPWQ